MTAAEALTAYELDDGVAVVTMDDGKVNALSPAMLDELRGALDRAEADEAVVCLTGREGTLSAGFDLRCEAESWPRMVAAGARLAERMLTFPQPIVLACNGNAIAMGAFLALSADLRVGACGDFRIGLNEVAIGLTIPWFGVALARHRLSPTHHDRCTLTGALLGPEEALAAGFLDELTEPASVLETALARSRELAGLDRGAHLATKLRARQQVIAGVRDGVERLERGDW